MKHDNKSLKKKIELYVYDSSPYYKCAMFKEEIEKLNDKLASCSELNNSSESEKILDENIENLVKNNTSLVAEMVELKSLVGQVSEEKQKLKTDMSACLKENSKLKETISRLIKDKKSLNQVLSILVNFQREGLGYTLNVTPWFSGAENSCVTSGFVEVFGASSTTKDEFRSSPVPFLSFLALAATCVGFPGVRRTCF